MSGWYLAPGTYTSVEDCGDHAEGRVNISATWGGQLDYGYVQCSRCAYARDLTDEEIAKYWFGSTVLHRKAT